MSKALIAFLALLGLFSFSSFAASDDGSSCRQNAELSQTANVRFPGASTCSSVGSVFTGNDHCTVKAGPGSSCEVDQHGVWVGIGYYFTGCLAGVACAEEPNAGGPMYNQLNLIGTLSLSAGAMQPPELLSFQTHVNYTELSRGLHFLNEGHKKLSANDNVINTNVLTLSDRMSQFSTYVNSAKTSSDSAKNAANAAKTSAENVYEQTTEILAAAQQIPDLLTAVESIVETNAIDALENTQLQQQTHEAQVVAQESLVEMHENLDAVKQDVYTAREFVVERMAMNKFDIIDAIERSASEADYGPMLQMMFEQDYATSMDIMNLTNTLSQVASGCVSDGRGGWDCSGAGSGTGTGQPTDMTETNSLLADIKLNTDKLSDDIDGLEDTTRDELNIINQTLLNGFSGGNGGSGGGSDNTENLLAIESVLWDSYDLHAQNAQSLSEISQTAVDAVNSVKDVQSQVTERLDTTNYELSELRSLLDSRTQTSNATLASIGTSVQSQGAQLTQISGTLDGIGESLDGIKEGFEGSAMTEADFTPEDGILSALGITGDESIEDLTDDTVRLQDYRNQYPSFLSAVCPENIPIEFRLFGAAYSFNLYYKPVCDFMTIAGTVLNFGVWFGVPFIVFGSRRVS